jgi:hypothetical protein
MNSQYVAPAVIWPYRQPASRVSEAPCSTAPQAVDDQGFDDAAQRLAAPGRALQSTMAAMVRIAVAQSDTAH